MTEADRETVAFLQKSAEYHAWRWPMRWAFSIFHFPSIFHLRNLKNVEKAAISCVFEVDC